MSDPTTSSDELDRSKMTFGEHLTELRARLIKALLATLVTVAAATIFAEDLVRVLLAPFQHVMRSLNANPALVANGPTTAIIVYFKVSMIAGLIVAAPVWLYQIWAFIAAGLYKKERSWVVRFAPFSLLLFAGGVVFGYVVLLPVALRFLLTFASPDLIQNWITIDAYMSLFTTLTLFLGVAFELPVIMLGLTKAGMLTAESFRKKRKITVLLIFVIAGILTPPDPITQPLVAIPLCFLYELGILLCWFAEGPKRQPIDLKKWRKRAVWIAALVLVVFIFRQRIAALWGGVDANDRVQTSASKLKWQEVAQRILQAPPEGAIRINDDATTPVLAMTGGGRVAVRRFVRIEDPAVVSAESHGAYRVISVQAGATGWDALPVDDLRMHDVLDPVVQALRVGDADTRKIARAIAAAAIGVQLPGDDEAAAKVADEWLASRRDLPFVQPRRRPGPDAP